MTSILHFIPQIDEAVRDLANQHRALTGTDDGELTIRAGEARTIAHGAA